MFVQYAARRLAVAASIGLIAQIVAFNARPAAAALPASAPPPSPSPASSPSSPPSLSSPSPAPVMSPPATPGQLREIGRVVTSDRRSEPLGDTSRPTFVVDRAHIEAYGARTVADALEAVPGVELYRDGPFGAQVSYGIRGSTSAQTLVLVDGQPVADPTSGQAYLENLSTIGVQRIEVVESGGSTLYGTGAVGGVINVITSVPRGAYLAASDGSYADRDLRVAFGDGRIGADVERHVATDAYAYPALRYGPGACDYGAFKPCTFPDGIRDAYGDQTAGRVSLDLPLGDGIHVRARADDAALQVGVPGPLTALSPGTSQAFSTATGSFELERDTRLSALTLDVSGVNGRFTYVSPPYGEDDTYFGRAQVSLKDVLSFGRDDVVTGIDLARQSGVFALPAMAASAYSAASPPSAKGSSQSQAAAYAQFDAAPLRGTRLTLGLRGENDAPHGTVLAPSFGGVVNAGAFRLSGNLGESFRVPTLEDLYYPGYSNPNLEPERAANSDLTLAYAAGAATLSAGWFARSGSNFIVLGPSFPVNVQRAQTAGLSVTAQARPLAGIIVDLNFTDLYKALDLSTGARLPNDPVGSATLGITRPFGNDRFSYGLRWRIVGSDGSDAANVSPPLSGTYDAYDSLDAFVRYKMTPQTVLTLRGFNLGGDVASPYFGYPLPARRLYVELSTR